MTIEQDEQQQAAASRPSAETVESPGEMIRRARTEAGFGAEEFATQIRLSRATLEALENDDYSTLREPVYVRGYYRKCAKVLGLSEEGLIGAYEKRAKPAAPAIPSKIPVVDGGIDTRGRGGMLRWLLGLLIIGGVFAAVAWYLQQEGGYESGLSSTGSQPVQQPLPPSLTDAAPPVASPAPVAPAFGGQADQPGADREAPADEATPGADQEQIGAAPQDPLVLRFKENSWVRVQGADGQTLLSGLVRQGTVRTFEGAAPYTLFLGYAPGVQVEFRGRPVDLAPATRENNTANLRLPSEG